MTDALGSQYLVAVVGAGPAGLFAARQLAAEGAHVVVFNRDIKPGGLAEYGIYPDKHKMKEGLRKQFRQLLALPQIEYYGHVTIGDKADLTLAELRAFGFQAVLVTVGAQGTKWLGLPGEDLPNVYHAKDLVYHYNQLPPYSRRAYPIGRRVAIVGVGNVMLDIAHWLIRDLRVDEVVAVARRGPAEVKFDKPEMEYVAANLDVNALDAELERVRPHMAALGQDVARARAYILAALPGALAPVSAARFTLDFLASPHRLVGADGRLTGLEVEETTLTGDAENPKARGLGVYRTIPADTVVFAIGDRVDEHFGLPVKANTFVKRPEPRFPVAGLCYEVYDPVAERGLDDVFVAGWSREASTGLVGAARKDGTNGAQAVLHYLQTLPPAALPALAPLAERLAQLPSRVVTKADLQRLEAAERAQAAERGLEEFKFATDAEMLAAMGLGAPQARSAAAA
ncbi:MAG: FAD-dependent oxidoreductase [Anaerolineales bacterium]|nr:FAD-dependent oxidoreductase [Anaerolineales bacterium]